MAWHAKGQKGAAARDASLAALERGREVLLVTVLAVPEDSPAAAPVMEAEPAAPLENATGEDL